ncbi:unnamed protein product [Rangifer tarandus platyrhynchus]|uniref:Uncharacterized protein n=2 Tax=Rangifer tarandus platyrhynchus TaxID=3082113 RepID=A0ACB0E8P5_RANTA|nr:unnamed protein product [Rangifer tarandus platyrhynchus]CAI9696814.1 unnamed protein product [Rangifer tarandus platyrhynchus]
MFLGGAGLSDRTRYQPCMIRESCFSKARVCQRGRNGALLRKYDAIGTKGPSLGAFRRLSGEVRTTILLNEPLLTLKSVRGSCGR